MYQQDSYLDFMPLRQSSTLTDDTLDMNDTDVYANVTVIWPSGYNARELELERARIEFEALKDGVPYVSMCDSFDATLPINRLASTLPNISTTSTQQNNNDETNEETVWMTALDISFTEESNVCDEEIVFHTVVDFMLPRNKVDNCRVHANSDNERIDALNDTLPMDNDLSLDDSCESN